MTLRTLVLVRHSDAERFAAGDRRRDLTAAGRMRAHDLGALLQARIGGADLALVSDALRARRTFEAIGERLPVERSQILRDLYTADAPELLDIAARAEARTLLIIGHEPTVSEAGTLIGDEAAAQELRRGVRTATALLVEIPEGRVGLIGAGLKVERICAPLRP